MKSLDYKPSVTRRHFVTSSLAAPLFLLPKESRAGINLIYETTIGAVDNWIYDGIASKIVITSLNGTQVRLRDRIQERSHYIQCNPKCSKTIWTRVKLEGPMKIVGRSVEGPTARLLVQVAESSCASEEACSVKPISSSDVRDALEWLASRGYDFDRF